TSRARPAARRGTSALARPRTGTAPVGVELARGVQDLLGAPARRGRGDLGREGGHTRGAPQPPPRKAALTGPRTGVGRRTISAAGERVFNAWLGPATLARFMLPGDASHATAEVDARVGGQFRIVMAHGRNGAEHWGEYLVIEPPARLSFTWISDNTDRKTTT